MCPIHIVTGTPGKKFEKRIKEITKDVPFQVNVKAKGDMFLLHQWIKNEPVDLLIGNTYCKYIARDEDHPAGPLGISHPRPPGPSVFPDGRLQGRAQRLLEKILRRSSTGRIAMLRKRNSSWFFRSRISAAAPCLKTGCSRSGNGSGRKGRFSTPFPALRAALKYHSESTMKISLFHVPASPWTRRSRQHILTLPVAARASCQTPLRLAAAHSRHGHCAAAGPGPAGTGPAAGRNRRDRDWRPGRPPGHHRCQPGDPAAHRRNYPALRLSIVTLGIGGEQLGRTSSGRHGLGEVRIQVDAVDPRLP